MTAIILGATGLLGSAICRELTKRGEPFVAPPRAELNLLDERATWKFFCKRDRWGKPKFSEVYLCAARVGGIGRNMAEPWQMLRDNLAIQQNVFNACESTGVKRLLFVGSSCMYPRDLELMHESDLLTGPLEPTNLPYAMSKLAGVSACRALTSSGKVQCVVPVLPNLYGPGDNFDLETCHVLPALIRRFHEAKVRCDDTVTLWGTGDPVREFLYVDDAARACGELMQSERVDLVNVRGDALAISALANQVKRVVIDDRNQEDFCVEWDTKRPDGFPRKVMGGGEELSGWSTRVPLWEGIARTYEWFCRESMRVFDRNNTDQTQLERFGFDEA